MVPKLVAEDIPLLYSLLSDVFPGIAHTRNEMTKLRNEVVKVCNDMHLVHGSGGDEIGNMWLEKVGMRYTYSYVCLIVFLYTWRWSLCTYV